MESRATCRRNSLQSCIKVVHMQVRYTVNKSNNGVPRRARVWPGLSLRMGLRCMKRIENRCKLHAKAAGLGGIKEGVSELSKGAGNPACQFTGPLSMGESMSKYEQKMAYNPIKEAERK